MARPTEYTAEIVEEAEVYLMTFAETGQQVIPTIEGLSLHLDISRDTIYEWAKEYSAFSYIVEKIARLSLVASKINLTALLLSSYWVMRI